MRNRHRNLDYNGALRLSLIAARGREQTGCGTSAANHPRHARRCKTGSSVLNSIPTIYLVIGVAIVVALSGEVGYRIGKAIEAQEDRRFDVVQNAAFAITGLLLAFSFSLALARYDARRETTLREANSIGTTILRTALLDRQTASAMRADLKPYVEARIAFARAGIDAERRASADARSTELQRHMWNLAMTAAERDPRSTMTPLFIETLNDTIDASSAQAAILEAHIPEPVSLVVIVIVMISAGLLGFGYASSRNRALAPSALFAIMLALVYGTIVDLDRPQRGLIRISLGQLEQLRADPMLSAPPEQPKR
jgi:hypothetical protein